MSASRLYKVHPYAIKTHEVADLSEVSTQAEFYSMADNSSTIIGIPILIAGGCWAWFQLHLGIRYIPTPSKLMISLLLWRRFMGGPGPGVLESLYINEY